MRMLSRLKPPPPPPPPGPPPPPRPPPLDAPEMSVPPDTLIRAPWYLRSMVLARIVVGHQFLADVRIQERGRGDDQGRNAHHHRAVVERPPEHLPVDGVHPRVEAAGLGGGVARFDVLLAQPHGAQRRRERE